MGTSTGKERGGVPQKKENRSQWVCVAERHMLKRKRWGSWSRKTEQQPRGEKERREKRVVCGWLVTWEGAHESGCYHWALNCAAGRKKNKRTESEEEGRGQDEGFGRVGRTGGLQEERSWRHPSQKLFEEWAASHWTRGIALHLCHDGKKHSYDTRGEHAATQREEKCLLIQWLVSISSFHAVSGR